MAKSKGAVTIIPPVRRAANGNRIPPNAGKGRPKDVPNKITTTMKEMILASLDAAGGVDYLLVMAYQEPAAYLSLLGKIVPREIGGDPNGVPIAITEIRRTIVRPK